MSDIIQWSLASVWNEVAYRENRPLEKRDYVYASELNQSLIDRYLKMNATPMSNPPNSRSQRKFLAGHLWEYAVKQVLVCAGLYRKEEVKIDETPFSDTLAVHGRCDFIAGGQFDYEEAIFNLEKSALPEVLVQIGRRIIDQYRGKLLQDVILELKSCSQYVINKVETLDKALPHHSLQAYHYQKNNKMGLNSSVCYLSKDDSLMQQFSVSEADCAPMYRQDLEQITHYFTKSIQPPPEPLATFDPILGKFSKNIIGVEYSCYLTHIYGFKDPEEYRAAVSYIEKWNRVLLRYSQVEMGVKTKSGKEIKLTPANKEVRADIEKAGYNFTELLETKIKSGSLQEEEEENE